MGDMKKKQAVRESQVWLLKPQFRELQTLRDMLLSVTLKTDEEMDRNDRALQAIDGCSGVTELPIGATPTTAGAGSGPPTPLDSDECELALEWTGRDMFVRPPNLDEEAQRTWVRVFNARMICNASVQLTLTVENVEGMQHAIKTLAAGGTVTGLVSERIGRLRRWLKAAKNGEEIAEQVERGVITPAALESPAPVGEA